MNYYEELGIRPDADEEEIRKAHRRMVKLMHPDQHRDQGLKQLAETQMRRLNSIVATLLDPEERREYDEQLRGGDPLNQVPRQSAWRSVPWWIASTLGAIVLTVGAVWFFADRIGSKFDTRSTPSAGVEEQIAKPGRDETKVIVPPPSPVLPTANPPIVTLPPASSTESSKDPENSTVAQVPVPSNAAKAKEAAAKPTATFPPPQTAIKPPATIKDSQLAAGKTYNPPTTRGGVRPTDVARAVPPPVVQHPTRKLGEIAPVTATASANAGVSNLGPAPALALGTTTTADNGPHPAMIDVPPPFSGPRDPLEGEWVYAPIEPEKHKPGFYPPEFIQLKLRKDTSGMRGEYSARYDVSDNKPVSPDVNFVLKAVDNKALRYVWTSSDGSRGWLAIRSLEPDTMRLEWKATSNHGGLSSGMATLVRKN